MYIQISTVHKPKKKKILHIRIFPLLFDSSSSPAAMVVVAKVIEYISFSHKEKKKYSGIRKTLGV